MFIVPVCKDFYALVSSSLCESMVRGSEELVWQLNFHQVRTVGSDLHRQDMSHITKLLKTGLQLHTTKEKWPAG